MKATRPKIAALETPVAPPYKVVTGLSLEAIEHHVNKAIGQGFLPVGSLTMCGNLLTQAVFRQTQNNPLRPKSQIDRQENQW